MANITKSATHVTTGKVRLSYANIWKARAINEGDEPKYSVSLIIPKSDKATLAKITNAIKTAKVEGKEKLVNKQGNVPENIKTPLRDGDTDETKAGDPAYANCYFLNCSSKQRPKIVDRNVQQILDEEAVYSGCYARVSLNFYAFNSNGNKGIAAGLGNIQFIADGEPLGGSSRPEDDFADDFEDDSDILG